MTPEEHYKMTQDCHNKLCRIESALTGDEMGSIGLVDRVKNIEKRVEINDAKVDVHIDKYEAKENKRSGIWAVLVALWGAVLFFVGKYL